MMYTNKGYKRYSHKSNHLVPTCPHLFAYVLYASCWDNPLNQKGIGLVD